MPHDAIDRAVFAELQAAAGAEFVAELTGTFLEEAPLILRDLRDAATKGDAERFRRAAHSLKSNASTFGATRMAALAREMENGGLAVLRSPAGLSLDALDAAYAAAAATLSNLKG
jgi:histidine phosphotransfer protein HptB